MGCLAYAVVLGPFKSQDKFAPRDRKSLFIGYHHNNKGYKLYDLNTHELFLSRDVTFFEFIFPFQHSASPSPSCAPPVQPFSLATDEEFVIHSSPSNELVFVFAPLKRSARSYHPPAWLNDFITPAVSHAAFHAFTHHLSPNSFVSSSPTHLFFLANITSISEPTSYSKVAKDPLWIEAMKKELLALESNHT